MTEDPPNLVVYASSFGTGADGAIHVLTLNLSTGRISQVHRQTDAENPFYLALSPDKRFLYSIHAPGEFEGGSVSEISAYQLDSATDQLHLLNRVSALGSAACYLAVDSTGSLLLVASYMNGSVSSFSIASDGSLQESSSCIQHNKFDNAAASNNQPHAHSIVFSPDNRFALACDLGMDRIFSYSIDGDSPCIKPNNPTGIDSNPGAGPRHLIFHPDSRHVYVINELDSTVTSYDYDAKSGTISVRQSVSTLPSGIDVENCPADLKVSPDGRFLYGTNRGHDSIAVFAIDSVGDLELIEVVSSRGASPQNISITPCGSLLLCANMIGDSIVVFRLDSITGHPSAIEDPISIHSPSCIAIR